jgi:hypothetical protein
MKHNVAGAVTFALIALLACGAALAQSSAPRDCAWETAERISLRELERSGERLVGRCVRVRGELNARNMRVERRLGATITESTMIGAYFIDGALRASFSERPRHTQALGVVGHCRNVCAAADPDTICMPSGHCHYYDDPYVMIQRVR